MSIHWLGKWLGWEKNFGDASRAPEVRVYTRANCHLCEEAKALLKNLQREEPFAFEEVDIDGDPELRQRYNDDVPVIYVHGRKAFKHRIDGRTFLKSLRAGRRA
ncbi:MAG: glutaredoxin family protein [Acidobacteria bacterium]|nr:glutaredoxin family protein [Acidobacteriota bacterium]